MSRPPSSLQVTPASPAPRRIRSALYWFGERFAVFRTTASPRDSTSSVRRRFKNACSSRELHAFVCLISSSSEPTIRILVVETDIVKRNVYRNHHLEATVAGAIELSECTTAEVQSAARARCPRGRRRAPVWKRL